MLNNHSLEIRCYSFTLVQALLMLKKQTTHTPHIYAAFKRKFELFSYLQITYNEVLYKMKDSNLYIFKEVRFCQVQRQCRVVRLRENFTEILRVFHTVYCNFKNFMSSLYL